MKRVLTAAMLVFTVPAAQADAEGAGVKDAVAAFGLLGTWAHVDCGQPASSANDYDIWTLEADGTLTETDNGGPDYKTQYRNTQARMIGDDRIAIDGVFLGDGHGQHLVLERRGDKQRVFESQDTTTGTMLIASGAFVDGGAATDWYVKCK